MRLLVTGGAGFIGSNFIRMVLKDRPSWEIVNLDLLTYAGNLESLEDISYNPRYTFIRGDISNPHDVDKAFASRIDVVVNFAAETHVDKSLYDSLVFLKTNVLGVGVLLEKAMKNSIMRFVQVSTDEVYGSTKLPETATEEHELNPSSPYAASKAGADLLCLSFFKTHATPAIITRSCNNYGLYQFPEKVIPFFITEACAGKHLPLYGRGENVRNWIHVVDNCRAILTVIEKGNHGEIYNIGGDNYLDNLALTKKLLKILDRSEHVIRFVEDRPGHDHRYAIDSSKIRRLGWAPCVDFEDGLRQTVEWYLSNEKWWRDILSGEHLLFYEHHYKNR